jgi:phenylpropionate dioxygenase-like ring-hydroxylating dioxygenase large terminal subunit
MNSNIILNSHSNTTLKSVLKKLQKVANTPFEEATPIPPAVNHSLEFYNQEQKKIFMKEWICVGREDEIFNTGDYITHNIAGVSVLIVRQITNEINVFINACAHRFTCLVSKTSGRTKTFTCPYHAWTYNLDGSLKRAPFMEMKKNFNLNDYSLKKLHSEVWEGFIYVTLAVSPSKSINSSLKNFKNKIVGRYDMGRYKTVMRESMVWNANWKNLIENFIESYHVPIAHQKTFAKHKKPIKDYVCGENSFNYCYHYASQQAETGLGAAHPNNSKLEGVWRRTMVDFCIFPNHLITLMPDYLWYISVQPTDIGQFKAIWGLAFPPEILSDIPKKKFEDWLSGMSDYMNIANDEDKLVVEGLYRGTSSSNLPMGTLHPIERNLWQFTRYLANKTKQIYEND